MPEARCAHSLIHSLILSLISLPCLYIQAHTCKHAHLQKGEEKDSGSRAGRGCATSKRSSVVVHQLRSICLKPPTDVLWPKEGISGHFWLCANSKHALLSWVKISSPHSMLPMKKARAENTDWIHKREEHKALETPWLGCWGKIMRHSTLTLFQERLFPLSFCPTIPQWTDLGHISNFL